MRVKVGCILEAPFQQICADHFPEIDLLVVRAGDVNPVAGHAVLKTYDGDLDM